MSGNDDNVDAVKEQLMRIAHEKWLLELKSPLTADEKHFLTMGPGPRDAVKLFRHYVDHVLVNKPEKEYKAVRDLHYQLMVCGGVGSVHEVYRLAQALCVRIGHTYGIHFLKVHYGPDKSGTNKTIGLSDNKTIGMFCDLVVDFYMGENNLDHPVWAANTEL